MVNYVHMGYGLTYKNYILLEIKDSGFQKEKLFKQADEYKKLKADLLEDGEPEESIDSFFKYYVTEYSSKIFIK